MKFGYFLNHNNLDGQSDFTTVLENGRDIARYCDRNDWDAIWTTEHHFGHEGLEVNPNPIMMGVDLAAHTERLRIGQAASIITFRHPVQLAEDVALLDHMSGGRVEFGIGRGIYPRETVNMNPAADVRNPEVNRALFKESLEIIREAWTNEFFSYEGEHYRFPQPGLTFDHPMSPPQPENTDETGHLSALSLIPKPLQQPHPPIWQVVDTEPSIRSAGEMGLNAMFWIPPTDALLPRFEMYQDARSTAQGHEAELGEGVAVLRDLFVTETMQEAERLAGEGLLTYIRWVCNYRGLANHRYPGEELPETAGKLDLLSYEWLHPRNMLFGTPDYVAEKIAEMRATLNLQNLLLWSSFPGVPHEAVMNSITMFTEEVMPQFASSDTTSDARGAR
ncbi:MAG: LLM class flavin-dependent oxidoreductase [Acidimicrobiales bacterium]|jgi:alkanesulfonate monooxygenase SsuD/methylene tetrahydromethanopterin reductase-like flavin-dependent oxidoreductase (luciferase family)|nr:LLM class flavin-dependent oxidoreductase [Acidimicrobiales bacterium]